MPPLRNRHVVMVTSLANVALLEFLQWGSCLVVSSHFMTIPKLLDKPRKMEKIKREGVVGGSTTIGVNVWGHVQYC